MGAIIEKAYISLGANLYEEREKGELEGIKGEYEGEYKKSYPRAVEDLWAGYGKDAIMVLAGVKCDMFLYFDFDEEKIKSAISQNLPFMCVFDAKFSFGDDEFIDRHAYSILGVVERNGETNLELADPHDAGKVLWLSFEELEKHIECYCIADATAKLKAWVVEEVDGVKVAKILD